MSIMVQSYLIYSQSEVLGFLEQNVFIQSENDAR